MSGSCAIKQTKMSNMLPHTHTEPSRFLDLAYEIQSMILDSVYEEQLYIHGEPANDEVLRRCRGSYRMTTPKPLANSTFQWPRGEGSLRQYIHNFQMSPLLVSRLFYKLAMDSISRKRDVLFRFPDNEVNFGFFLDLRHSTLRNPASIVSVVQIHELARYNLSILRTCFPRLKRLELGTSSTVEYSLFPVLDTLSGKQADALLSGSLDKEVINTVRKAIKVVLSIFQDTDLDDIVVCFSFQMHAFHFSPYFITLKAQMIVFDCEIDQHGGRVVQKWFRTHDAWTQKGKEAGQPAYVSYVKNFEIPSYQGVDPTIREYKDTTTIIPVCRTTC